MYVMIFKAPFSVLGTYSIAYGRVCELAVWNNKTNSNVSLVARTLPEAKSKCWRDDECIGFFHDGWYRGTKNYYQCASPMQTETTSDRADVVYRKKKNGKCIE